MMRPLKPGAPKNQALIVIETKIGLHSKFKSMKNNYNVPETAPTITRRKHTIGCCMMATVLRSRWQLIPDSK